MRIFILALWICSCRALNENCPRPALGNGFFVPHNDIYEHGVKVSYGCKTGMKPALRTWWGEITCSHGNWSHRPTCIDDAWCIVPRVSNGRPETSHSSFPPGVVAFECDHGYEFKGKVLEALCENGVWKVLPECTRKHDFCAPPPRVYNTIITSQYKDVFEKGEKLDYVCAEGYVPVGGRVQSSCKNGNWVPKITCERKRCPKPAVQNGQAAETLQASYNDGEKVRFTCDRHYEIEGTDTAVCKAGSWSLPVCKGQDESVCTAPYVPNGRAEAELAQYYPDGRTVTFVCNQGFAFEGVTYARCVQGNWILPVCKSAGAEQSHRRPDPGTSEVWQDVLICGPHPLIENGDVTELPDKKGLKVQCKKFYQLAGPDTVRCVDVKWTELPGCIAPCKLDSKMIYSGYEEYLSEGKEESFYCPNSSRGWYQRMVRCVQGTAYYSNCYYTG